MPLFRAPASVHAGATALALAACLLPSCKRNESPPLPPELAAVQCPADKAEHGVARIDAAQITWLCVEPQLAAHPQMLACDNTAIPPVCDGSGMLLLRRDAQGIVHTDSVVNPAPPPGIGTTDESQLLVYFHKGPPLQATFDPVDTPYRFMMADARDALPAGFTFVKGAQCDRAATVLGTGTCNIEARTPSLYWNITISVRHKQGTPIPASEYRREFDSWMKYLGEMVVDPKT